MSGPTSQSTNLGEGRSMRRDVSRRTMPRASTSRGDEMKSGGAPHAAAAAAGTMGPPRHRTAEDERARAAARQAEKEMWERTRGAGSAVFKLAESGRIRKDESHEEWAAEDILPSLEEIEKKHYEIVEVPSIDVLLSRGICDYTLLPKTLGRGKFSTVFMASRNGELSAIKHTALFPHHQLISTRLLREPTLLAELPPHPNLVAVKETIRTPGHFYLVEEYLGGYVTLEALLPMLSTSQPAILPIEAAEKILTQLLSAVHSIHVPLQICHRDIKPENILVHPETLQLKLLDFGLATHYSKSEAKLSTCCGSPAFHCPEIVRALASPPGTITYMGPEVDAWTCGVTMLRCLTGQRFPLGASHSSMRGMAIRAQRAVASIADEGMRSKVGALLDMDGPKRMKRFEELVAEQERVLGEPPRDTKKFKSTTFIPIEPTHSIKLPLLASHLTTESTVLHTSGLVNTHPHTNNASRRTTPAGSRQHSPVRSRSSTPTLPDADDLALNTIIALNPTLHPPERVLSFVKYCLRCAGILYHSWPDTSNTKEASTSPLGYFNGRASQSQTSLHLTNAGFAEALDSSTQPNTPSQPHFSPVTPLFPSFHEPEDRSDGFSHVQVFQCVMEVSESSKADETSGEQFSLYQSIMAAFGRKKAVDSTTAASPRPANRRSLSTPAQARAKVAAQAPGTPTTSSARSSASTKDGNVKCLAFYIVLKFPKQTLSAATHHPPAASHSARVTPSRTTSSMSLGQQAATNSFTAQGRHSRANSGAIAFPSIAAPLLEEAEYDKGGTEGTSNGKHISFSGSNPGHKGMSNTDGVNLEINTDLPLHPSFAALSSPRSHHSPSSSRATSRTRKRSHRGPQKKARIIIKVSDPRATQTIRDALSVGGSIQSWEEMDQISNHHRHSHHMARSSTALNLTTEGDTHSSRSADVRTPVLDEGKDAKGRDTTPVGRVITHQSSRSSATGAKDSGVKTTTRGHESEEEEPRGRQMGNAERVENLKAKSGRLRAPSQLSSLPLQEESPTGGDLKQTMEALTLTLQTMTSTSAGLTPEVTITSPSSSIPNGQGSDAATSSQSANSSLSMSSLVPNKGYTGGETPSQTQARSLLMDISSRLQQAEKSGSSALEDVISPVSFALFSALSPALGLIPQETKGLPIADARTQPGHVRDAATHRGLAMSSLRIMAHSVSPREMFMATQERLELISSERKSVEQGESKDSLSLTSKGLGSTSTLGMYSSGLEVAGLLHFLSMVIPRIQTQRPVNFIQPLTALLPRVMQVSLRLQTSLPMGSSETSLKGDSNPQTPNSEPSSKSLEGSDEAIQVSNETMKLAIREAVQTLAQLMHSIKVWSSKVEGKEAELTKVQRDKLFFGCVIVMVPLVAQLDNEANISTLHFKQTYPQFTFKSPSQQQEEQKISSATNQKVRSKSQWTVLSEIIADLSIDLEQYAFQKPKANAVGTAEVSSTIAIVTMGSFILHVHLQFHLEKAYEQWDQDECLDKLKRAMPILLASLGSGPPATISTDGMHALGGASNLTDAALSWLMWCIQGINRESNNVNIDGSDVLMMIQMLSSHAALSPDPTSRLIGITLVETILSSNVKPDLGRDILRDLIIESPFPQLKSASVGLAKRLIASDLNVQNETYASRDMLEMISSVMLQLPHPTPSLDQYDASSLTKAYLDDHGAWLSELLSFVFLVASLDRHNQTGLLDETSIASIKSHLLDGLDKLLALIQENTNPATSSKDEMEMALQGSLLAVALDRAKGVFDSHQSSSGAT